MKLKPYSNSRLVDITTCPTWGIVHSQRSYAGSERAMALDAGATMHQVFAAVRVWQLGVVQGLPHHATTAAYRLFGSDRVTEGAEGAGINIMKWHCEDDRRDQLISWAYSILHSSGWYDDPSDTMRTFANMEVATIRYCDERLAVMDTWPVWVEDKRDPTKRVGIEQVFDVTLHYSDRKRIRYIGTIDGLVFSDHYERYYLDENKTASRLDGAWQSSFDMSHQITGYCAASSTVFGFSVLDARIMGIKIKQGNYGDNSQVKLTARTSESIQHWANWVRYAVDLEERYHDDWEHAPRFTHSCNRYFRPCALIGFCSDDAAGRAQQFEEMVPTPPSPSEAAIEALT